MKVVKIRKKKGGYRTIYMPSDEEKEALRGYLSLLQNRALALDKHGVSHAFTPGRSPVTNAIAHIGWRYTISFDLADFFDSVTPKNAKFTRESLFPHGPPNPFMKSAEDKAAEQFLAHEALFFPDGAARQGLPTSPSIANIAFAPADEDIMNLQQRGRFAKANFCYTRYADDLTFSCDTMDMVRTLEDEVPKIVERYGFKINESKTRIQCAKAGRRIITGVGVGDKDVDLPRWVKRRIRAGQHQLKHGLRKRCINRLLEAKRRWKLTLPLKLRLGMHVKGLKEWAKLKLPDGYLAQQEKNKTTKTAHAKAVAVGTTASSPTVWQRFGAFVRKFG